jgi:hypothetical protein
MENNSFMDNKNYILGGTLVGIYLGISNNKGFWVTLLYSCGFGLVGGLVGTTVNKIKNKE